MGIPTLTEKTDAEKEEELEEERHFRAGRKRSNAVWSRRPPVHHTEQDPLQPEALQDVLQNALEDGADQAPEARFAGAQGMQRIQQDTDLQDPSVRRDVSADAVQNAMQQRSKIFELAKANQAKKKLAREYVLNSRIRERNEGKEGFFHRLGHMFGAAGDFLLSMIAGAISRAVRIPIMLPHAIAQTYIKCIEKKADANQALQQLGIGDAADQEQNEATGKAGEDVPVTDDIRRIPQHWEEQTADTTEEQPKMELQVKQAKEGSSRVVEKISSEEVGHAFIRLRYTKKDRLTGKKKRYRVTFGFYPAISSGAVEMAYDTLVPGELQDDKNHPADIGKSYSVTNRIVNQVLSEAEKYPQGGYSLTSRNCTTFAYEMSKLAGIDTSFFKDEAWELPNLQYTAKSVLRNAGSIKFFKARKKAKTQINGENWKYENLYQNPDVKKRASDDMQRYDHTSSVFRETHLGGYSPAPTAERMRLTRTGSVSVMEDRNAIGSNMKGMELVSALTEIMFDIKSKNTELQNKFAANGNHEGILDQEVSGATKNLDKIVNDSEQVFNVSVQDCITDDMTKEVSPEVTANQLERTGNALKVWNQRIALMQTWLQTEGSYDQELNIAGYHMLRSMVTIAHVIEERNLTAQKRKDENDKRQILDPLTLQAMHTLSDTSHINYGYDKMEKIMRMSGKDISGVFSEENNPNAEHRYLPLLAEELNNIRSVICYLQDVTAARKTNPNIVKETITGLKNAQGMPDASRMLLHILEKYGENYGEELDRLEKRQVELTPIVDNVDLTKSKADQTVITAAAKNYASSLQYYVQKDKLSQKDTDFIFQELSRTEGTSEYQKVGQDAVKGGPDETMQDAGDAMRMITLNRVYGALYSYMGECAGQYAASTESGDPEAFLAYLGKHEIFLLHPENTELTQEQTEAILSAAAIKRAAELSIGSRLLRQMIISSAKGILAANHNPDRADVTDLILHRILGRNIALNAENGVAVGKLKGYTQDNYQRIGKQVMGLNADAAGSLVNVQTAQYRGQMRNMVSRIVDETMKVEAPAADKKISMQKAISA